MPENIDTNNEHNVEQPQYLTKEEFGRTAAIIRQMRDENATLKATLEAIVERGEDGTVKIKSAAPKPAEKDDDVQTQLNALRNELKKRDDIIAEKDRKAADANKRNAITSALSKSNAVNAQRDSVHLFDIVKQNNAGDYVIFSKDDVGNDVETPLQLYVDGWLKSNPELVKASTKSGSGTPTGHHVTPTYDPYNTDMAQFVKNRKDILAKRSK